MGLFDNFPYTNFHELNLDWILKVLKDIENTIDEFVSLNIIKYADPIQWDIVRQYPKNTIVIDPVSGTAYISVDNVPQGVPLSNTDYWSVVFDLGRFITLASQNFALSYEAVLTTTATMPTVEGGWVVWNSILYEALNDIHVGDAYVINGNIKKTPVEEFFNRLKATVTQEILDRQAADTALGGRIDQEILDRQAADTALTGRIDQEILDRQTTDSALSDRIDHEIIDRQAADTALGGRIDQEILDRQSADTALDQRVTANENAIASEQTLINNIISSSSLAGESNYLIVAKKGGRFTNINDAITYAQTYCSETNRVAIIIMDGIYTETIKLFPNNGIDLLGVGDVTIQAEAIYPESPLYVGGNITVENIKFLAFNSSQPSYGLHIEAAAENCILKFTNCQFTSVQTSGAGIGMHNAMEVTFTNCKFISWTTNSVYAHNFPGPASAVGQKLRFFGCEFQSLDANAPDAVIEDATFRMGYGGVTSRMDVSFAHSVFNKGQIQYVEVNDGVITTNQPFLPALGNVRLDINSIATLYSVDYYKYTPHIKNTSYADAIGVSVIPFNNANKYTWHVDEVKNQSGAVITSDASVLATDSGGVTIHTPNNVSQNNIYTISGVPSI